VKRTYKSTGSIVSLLFTLEVTGENSYLTALKQFQEIARRKHNMGFLQKLKFWERYTKAAITMKQNKHLMCAIDNQNFRNNEIQCTYRSEASAHPGN
jgi:hypothetical protein